MKINGLYYKNVYFRFIVNFIIQYFLAVAISDIFIERNLTLFFYGISSFVIALLFTTFIEKGIIKYKYKKDFYALYIGIKNLIFIFVITSIIGCIYLLFINKFDVNYLYNLSFNKNFILNSKSFSRTVLTILYITRIISVFYMVSYGITKLFFKDNLK